MRDSPVPEQEPAFRWKRQDLIAFAGFFVATVFFLPFAIYLVLRLFQPDLQVENLSSVQKILILAFMNLVLVAFIFFLAGVLHGRPIFRTLHCVPREGLGVGRFILAGALLATIALIFGSFFPEPTDSPVQELLTTTSSIVLFVIVGIAVAPLLEEIIFRGFIFSVLTDLYGWKAAVPITTVLFVAMHVPQLGGNLPALAVILLVGYVLTVVRQRTNSMIPSVIVHTAYNTTIFALGSLLGPAK